MSESWQDWGDPKFHEFLEEFYRAQVEWAKNIVKEAAPLDFTALTVAVFGKVAPPAVYLKAEYDAWLEKTKKSEQPIILESKAMTTKWRDSKKNLNIEWCPEQEADPVDAVDAKEKRREMWYLPPRNGFKYGSIFRRKPQK